MKSGTALPANSSGVRGLGAVTVTSGSDGGAFASASALIARTAPSSPQELGKVTASIGIAPACLQAVISALPPPGLGLLTDSLRRTGQQRIEWPTESLRYGIATERIL
jgi:hypothetical protein